MDNEVHQASSLADLLKGNSDNSAPVEAVETPPPEAASPPPEAAASSADPKGDTETAPPAANNERTVPLSALEKVRAEAKAAKDRLAELEARMNAPAPVKREPLDPVTMDPAAYEFARKAETSEMILRSQKDDYDATVAAYTNAVQRGDAPLIPPSHPSPAQFAYDWGKKVQKLNDLGPLDDLETRLRSKWEAELAEVAAKQKADEAARVAAQIMPTNAGQRNAAPRDEEGKFSGPRPLADLIRKKTR